MMNSDEDARGRHGAPGSVGTLSWETPESFRARVESAKLCHRCGGPYPVLPQVEPLPDWDEAAALVLDAHAGLFDFDLTAGAALASGAAWRALRPASVPARLGRMVGCDPLSREAKAVSDAFRGRVSRSLCDWRHDDRDATAIDTFSSQLTGIFEGGWLLLHAQALHEFPILSLAAEVALAGFLPVHSVVRGRQDNLIIH